MEIKFCPNCRKTNTQDHKFCRICGAEIQVDTKGDSQPTTKAVGIFNDFKKKGFIMTLLVSIGILFILFSLLKGDWAEENAMSAHENQVITKLETTVRKIGEHIESISVTGRDLPAGAQNSFYDRVYANDDIDIPYIVNLAGEAVSLYENYVQDFGSDRYKFDKVASLARTAFFFVKQEEVDRAASNGDVTAISNIISRVNTFSNKRPFYSHLEKKGLLDDFSEFQSVLKQSKRLAADISELGRLDTQIDILSTRADHEYEANRQYNELVESYNLKLGQVDSGNELLNTDEAHQNKLALVEVELLVPSIHEIGISNASGAIK